MIRYAVARREALRVELEHFRDAVLGKPADIVTLWQGVGAVEVGQRGPRRIRDRRRRGLVQRRVHRTQVADRMNVRSPGGNAMNFFFFFFFFFFFLRQRGIFCGRPGQDRATASRADRRERAAGFAVRTGTQPSWRWSGQRAAAVPRQARP